MKLIQLSSRGFAHIHFVIVGLVIAVIGLAGGNVYQVQQKQREAARQAAQAEEIAKQAKLTVKDESSEQKVDIPAPASEQKPVEEPKPTPKPTAPAPKPTNKVTEPAPTPKKTESNYVGISAASHIIDGDAVKVTANLPASFTGTCKIKVKSMTDSSKYYYKEAALNGTSCTVSYSKSTLAVDGSQWMVYASYVTSDYKTNGAHSGYTFNL